MARPPLSDADRAFARQSRLVGLVLLATMALWLGAQWLAAVYNWESRIVGFFDLAALAAFVWTMAVTYRMWRQSKSASKGN